MVTTATLSTEAHALAQQLIEWRRDFHQHPELGYQEVRTSGIVAKHLQDLGLEVATGIGKTGVVAIIEGDEVPADAPTLMLRFDMDALPIQEVRDVPYKSQTPNVMHACGHDGHTAIGMGVATLLNRHRHDLPGRVKLVFQPAEEGLGGAMAMINDGVMNSPAPEAAFGMHLWSRLPLNQVIVQEGPLWAAADLLIIKVHGKSGHGAVPQETVDATLVAAHILIGFQSIVSRNVSPTDSVVITVGKLTSGDASNVISGYAEMRCSIRTLSPDSRDMVIARMRALGDGIAAGFGATCEIEHVGGISATSNSREGAALMQTVATDVVGEELVKRITPMMVSEDMAEFLNRAPGCFILVGASDPNEEMHAPHHNSSFDFDERVLPTGAALLAGAAVEWLRQKQGQSH